MSLLPRPRKGFLRRFIPNVLEEIDHRWVTRRPILGLLRVHFVGFYGSVLLLLGVLYAFLAPRSVSNFPNPDSTFFCFALAMSLGTLWWAYLQARDSSELRFRTWWVGLMHFLGQCLCVAFMFLVPLIVPLVLESRIRPIIEQETLVDDYWAAQRLDSGFTEGFGYLRDLSQSLEREAKSRGAAAGRTREELLKKYAPGYPEEEGGKVAGRNLKGLAQVHGILRYDYCPYKESGLWIAALLLVLYIPILLAVYETSSWSGLAKTVGLVVGFMVAIEALAAAFGLRDKHRLLALLVLAVASCLWAWRLFHSRRIPPLAGVAMGVFNLALPTLALLIWSSHREWFLVTEENEDPHSDFSEFDLLVVGIVLYCILLPWTQRAFVKLRTLPQ